MATIHPFSPPDDDGSRVRQNELSAMRSLGAALEELADDRARARVIRWAIDVFGLTIAVPAAAEAAPSPAARSQAALAVDPTLTVEGVDEFFESVASREPHSDVVHWPSLSVEAPDDVDTENEWEELPPVSQPAQPDQGVASMVHGFVADFQKLARDWSDKTESGDRRIE